MISLPSMLKSILDDGNVMISWRNRASVARVVTCDNLQSLPGHASWKPDHETHYPLS